MESEISQPKPMTDWNTWSRIIDAAQDPRHRDVVQKYLAQVELSADVPAAIDEKLLAPRRAAGATGEQCAYVYCNLGFAALVAGSRESAEFAIGCGRLVRRLAPETPDLLLRCHFLFTKGALMLAALVAQPHLIWDTAAKRCIAFLRAVEQHLDAMPAEAIEANAMAAYSFAAQLLTRVRQHRAVGHYASEVSQLVAVAFALASRLPTTFATRMWNSIIPGRDSGALFRQVGAEAEGFLQVGEKSVEHAETGIAYADAILSGAGNRPVPDLARVMQTRAELLLLAGRDSEAMEQVADLENLPDPSAPKQAILLRARQQLRKGDPQAAADLLAQIAPTVDQALETWRANWVGDAGEGHWTADPATLPSPQLDHEIWGLQAASAAARGDMPDFLVAADRFAGFLADSLLRERQQWVDRISKASGERLTAADQTGPSAAIAPVEPAAALDEVFARLADGTALLQLLDTKDGLLIWIARKNGGAVSQFIAPGRPAATALREAHKAWSQSYLGNRGRAAAAADGGRDASALFSALMDELARNWGDLLQGLLQDGVTRLVLIGDDLVDMPLHATRIGSGDERLIDHVPVSYCPSLSLLLASVAREPIEVSRRPGLQFVSLAEPDSAAGELTDLLKTKPLRIAPPIDASFWTDAAAAEVLQIVARTGQNARLPLDSVLAPGWLDVSFSQLLVNLDLPHCDVVSMLSGESALPSALRAPGFDLAAVFLAAGARNVLASTWLASDELASDLLRAFIRRWVEGQMPSSAFRDALLQIRSERPSLTDFEWAGMRLVGAP
jgi:hypothetical protein